MALFPLCVNFEGDFVLQLVPVDSENSMDEVAKAAAHHTVGRRVKNQPNRVLRVRRSALKSNNPFMVRKDEAATVRISRIN